MMQTCSAAFWEGFDRIKPESAPCGQRFDDEHQSTMCPHLTLPPAGPVIRSTPLHTLRRQAILRKD